MTRAMLAALLLLGTGTVVEGQRPGERPPPTAPRPPADTAAPRDTARRQLVEWPEPDSVMAALLARNGFVATRFRGDSVVFHAPGRIIELRGRAAVQRGDAILVSDTIIYNDSTQVVFARGDTSVLRDPEQGQDDIVARHITYNLLTRRGLVTDVRTVFESGERWYVHAGRAAPQLADTATGQPTAFYGHDGSITSCDLVEPHYHFGVREVKVVSKNTLVARPAILYIADIPVMWLPFIFQDLRDGRRSGLLTPRFGVSDIVRNSTNYRRQIENIGYYFALNDFMDAEIAMDWRSGARGIEGDPGWTRYRLNWNYNWLNRFLRGGIGASHHSLRDGSTNSALSWRHTQNFSLTSSLNANVNYMTNTRVQRQTTFNPYEQLASIQSNLNYQRRLGPAQFNVGGTRRQYVGREQVEQTFPTLTLSTGPLNVAPWLVWTPSLNLPNSQTFHSEQGGGLAFRFDPAAGGGIDSARIRRDLRNTSIGFDTPLQLFGFRWQNSVTVRDNAREFPEPVAIVDVNDTTIRSVRVFERRFTTEVNWETGISLPPMLQGTWNLVPNVSIQNVDPRFGFLVRSERTGGEFVAQSKRLVYGVSASPTIYGLLPGFGAFSRLRHSIRPSLSYSYAPAASVGDDFLAAIGGTRVGYLGSLAQNNLSLGLSQTVEARLRSPADTAPGGGEKMTLLSLNFSPISYDIERAREVTRRARLDGRDAPGFVSGFTTQNLSMTARSDLLPGFDFSVDYSLFEGSTLSDTARFAPYRERVSASFQINRRTNPFVVFSRIFGKAVPPSDPEPRTDTPEEEQQFARGVANMPLPGSQTRAMPIVPGAGQGWNASLTFSSSRQRPPVGVAAIEIDPAAVCESFLAVNPIQYDLCVREQRRLLSETGADTLYRGTIGGPVYRSPPMTTLQTSLSFNPTARWTAQWQTTYDFVEHSFASHIVSLQRDLHDWRAIFAFTQAPNGNFAFNFFIALKAQPDLKFDYHRQNYRPPPR